MARQLQRTPVDLGLRSGALFGVLMGGFFAVLSVPFLLFTGPLACGAVPLVFLGVAGATGPAFGVLMGLFAATLSVPPSNVEAGETLLLWGGANLSGNGGILALSDRRLWFTTHAMNLARPDFSLLLSEIDTVEGTDGLLAGTLVIRDRAGKKYKLKLDFGVQWAEQVRSGLPG